MITTMMSTITLAEVLEVIFSMPTIMFIVGGVIAVVAIIFGSISTAVTRTTESRERERSRREIAAYVAEGTIDADKAIEMLKVGEATRADEEDE